MLKRENYTSEHIDALRKQTGADPSILERTYMHLLHPLVQITLRVECSYFQNYYYCMLEEE